MEEKLIKAVGVCGAGTMGSGIAQVAATAGYATVLYEMNEEVLAKAQDSIARSLQIMVEKGKLQPEQKETIYSRIHFSNVVSDCKGDLIIEAIIEKLEAKAALFAELAKHNSPQTIFASNTSSLSINEVAKRVQHPGRLAGLHFFNPAPLMKLVEVVKGEQTSDEVICSLIATTTAMGKTPVLCKDAPGFIVNRVARPYYIEALRLAEAGHDIATIDRLLESRGFKMGPFKLMDLIGNDINYAVSCSVYDQLNKPERLKPSYIQQQKVENKELGRKTGKGYYQY